MSPTQLVHVPLCRGSTPSSLQQNPECILPSVPFSSAQRLSFCSQSAPSRVSPALLVHIPLWRGSTPSSLKANPGCVQPSMPISHCARVQVPGAPPVGPASLFWAIQLVHIRRCRGSTPSSLKGNPGCVQPSMAISHCARARVPGAPAVGPASLFLAVQVDLAL